MSYVTFASEHASVDLRGRERAHAGGVTRDIATGMLNARHHAAELMARCVNPASYLRDAYDRYQRIEAGSAIPFGDSFTLAFSVDLGDPLIFKVGSRTATAFQVQLNTAMVVGNDVTRFLARMHAQCELHGWVAEGNREWLAGIIDEGRASGLMRADGGWEKVAELLRNGDGGPVVTSYSVTECFPSRWEINWTAPGVDEDDDMATEDAWGELPDSERWALGVAALREDAEWSPERHALPHFGDGLTVFDLLGPLADPVGSRR